MTQKDLKPKEIIYQQVLSRIIMSLLMEKDFYNQSIDSVTKRYVEIRKLTTG